jgi:ferredoxin-NADP reductase
VQQEVTRSFTLVNPTSTQVRFTVQSQDQGLFSVHITQGKSLIQV